MEHTIAAISTSIGEAGIGIVRMTGRDAIAIGEQAFHPIREHRVGEKDHRMLLYGHILDEDQVIDEVLIAFMFAPHTYTREDMVEIYTHGSTVSVKKVLELLLKLGAQVAERGEFTKRAFLNGRLDLSQAEAVIDLIQAKTERSYNQSLYQLNGGLKHEVQVLRDGLMRQLAYVEVAINFSEDGQEELSTEKLQEGLRGLIGQIQSLLDTTNKGKILRDGVNTIIIGKPNVGKSSLLNLLLREERAIVTDVPGTTRDVIEEFINIREVAIRLVDTAGIRDTQDQVEKIGVERSVELSKKADLIVAVFDISKPLDEEDQQIIELIKGKKAIVLLNKIDLGSAIVPEEFSKLLGDVKIIETSMNHEIGIHELEEAIVELFYLGDIHSDAGIVISNARHEDLLNKSLSALESAYGDLIAQVPLDCLEVDLRDAWTKLGEITGETATTEDLLDKIFGEFCIGK